jgi:hypothetical protein
MKTAIQELIEIINDNLKNEYTSQEFARLTIFKASAERLLEKEKEQIVNAYDRGYKACDLDEALEINKTMFSGERYYEQTYKPETI